MARRREVERVDIDEPQRTPLDDVLDELDRKGPGANPRLHHEEWAAFEARWAGQNG